MDTKSAHFKKLRNHARRQLERDKALIQDLKSLRIEQELSQDEVAFRMGVTQPAVSAIEKGNSDPHLSTIRRMALALGCEVSYTVTRSDEEQDHDAGVRTIEATHENVPTTNPWFISKQPNFYIVVGELTPQGASYLDGRASMPTQTVPTENVR